MPEKVSRLQKCACFTHWLLIQLYANVESFITLAKEFTKDTAFSRGNLAVEMLSEIVSTIQDSANAVSANTFLCRDAKNVFHHHSRSLVKRLFNLDLRKIVPYILRCNF